MTNMQQINASDKWEMASFLSQIGVDCAFCPVRREELCTKENACAEAWYRWLGNKTDVMAEYWL